MASLNLWTMKLTLQQGNRMTSALHVSLLLIFSLTTIKDMLIQQISLQRLRCIRVHFKIAGYRNKTKMITITQLINNWLMTLDLRDMMGYNKNSSKEPQKYLKRNGAPFSYSWIINKGVSSPKEVSEKKRLSLYFWIINKEVSWPNTIKATFYYQRRYYQWLKYRFRIISLPIVCIYISSSCWYFIGWRLWKIPPDY